jgi:Ni/Co efflux regulator RcnB
MKNRYLITLALGAALTAAPVWSVAAPQQHHDDDHHAAPAYHFQEQDRAHLQSHYRSEHIQVDTAHRWAWHRGENFPVGWHDHIRPLPQVDISLLPPPPPGYVFGYYDGWAVVYDPSTGVILDAVDVM